MCRFWFDSRTISVKIRPQINMAVERMNEELKQASELLRDPASVSWTQYFWVILLATWGGIVRVIREVKFSDKTWKQILVIFIAEILVSTFAGVLTFFICLNNNVTPLYTAVMTSLAGYLGGRALNVLELLYSSKISKGE